MLSIETALTGSLKLVHRHCELHRANVAVSHSHCTAVSWTSHYYSVLLGVQICEIPCHKRETCDMLKTEKNVRLHRYDYKSCYTLRNERSDEMLKLHLRQERLMC